MSLRSALHRLRGGIHPLASKEATVDSPIVSVPVPKTLLVSLAQHLGAPSRPLVKKGDGVLKGQAIAAPTGYVSAWVHAPTSGTVKSIGTRATASGQLGPVIEIEADGHDRDAASHESSEGWDALPAHDLVDLVARAGVVGMGGAGFPTNVKLLPPPGKTISTLLVNGAECEPGLTADHRLMVEEADRIWQGVLLLRRILGAAQVRIAIEDDKPGALAAMEKAMTGAAGDVQLVALRTQYPQGAEKQLIHALTGREVPTGGLPMDVGCLVENVGTAAAVRDAIVYRRALIERVITVTGAAIRTPRNVRARVGTPLHDLIAFCGGTRGEVGKVLCGGPMMGVAQASAAVGVNKTTSGLLLQPRHDVGQFRSMPCISCGRCVAACPAFLLPCTLSEAMEADKAELAESLNVLDCIECGACAYVCPAHRPMVQHMRQGKARALRRRQREAQAKKDKAP